MSSRALTDTPMSSLTPRPAPQMPPNKQHANMLGWVCAVGVLGVAGSCLIERLGAWPWGVGVRAIPYDTALLILLPEVREFIVFPYITRLELGRPSSEVRPCTVYILAPLDSLGSPFSLTRAYTVYYTVVGEYSSSWYGKAVWTYFIESDV